MSAEFTYKCALGDNSQNNKYGLKHRMGRMSRSPEGATVSIRFDMPRERHIRITAHSPQYVA